MSYCKYRPLAHADFLKRDIKADGLDLIRSRTGHLRPEDAKVHKLPHSPHTRAHPGRHNWAGRAPGAEPEAEIRGKPVGAIIGQDIYKNNF